MAIELYAGWSGDAPRSPADLEGRFATVEAAMARAGRIAAAHVAIVVDGRPALIGEGRDGGGVGRALVWRGVDGAPVPVVEPAVEVVLADEFPPRAPLPTAAQCGAHLAWLRREARGEPGDPVRPGLMPDARTKNARLVRSLAGDLWPSRTLAVARDAYGPARSSFAKPPSYHAHDAVACALVDPRLPRALKSSLIAHLGAETALTRGWRSRHKTWALWRWAAARGLVDGPP